MAEFETGQRVRVSENARTVVRHFAGKEGIVTVARELFPGRMGYTLGGSPWFKWHCFETGDLEPVEDGPEGGSHG